MSEYIDMSHFRTTFPSLELVSCTIDKGWECHNTTSLIPHLLPVWIFKGPPGKAGTQGPHGTKGGAGPIGLPGAAGPRGDAGAEVQYDMLVYKIHL